MGISRGWHDMQWNCAIPTKNYLLYTTALPVNMASFTIQFPTNRAASHGMLIPFFGITNTSPGTRSSDETSITNWINDPWIFHTLYVCQHHYLYHFVRHWLKKSDTPYHEVVAFAVVTRVHKSTYTTCIAIILLPF